MGIEVIKTPLNLFIRVFTISWSPKWNRFNRT